MKRPTLAALALSLLALLFGWETREALEATPGGRDNVAMATAWRPGVAAPDPQPPPDPTPSASAVAARPLFRQDRQPFREAAAGASARNFEAELARYMLLGVLGLGDAPFGVVVGKAGNKGERWEVKRGDTFQGFTVKEIGLDGLQLTTDGREFLLPLYAGAPTAPVGSRRTETPRRDAVHPGAVPHAASASAPGAAPASASGAAPGSRAAAMPGPTTPSTSPLASRLRRAPTVPTAPGVSPAPFSSGPPPADALRYNPGNR